MREEVVVDVEAKARWIGRPYFARRDGSALLGAWIRQIIKGGIRLPRR
jgi:hypothetical protein